MKYGITAHAVQELDRLFEEGQVRQIHRALVTVLQEFRRSSDPLEEKLVYLKSLAEELGSRALASSVRRIEAHMKHIARSRRNPPPEGGYC